MSIAPISGLGSIPVGGGPSKVAGGAQGGQTFTDALKNAIDNVEHLDAVKKEDSYNLALGEVDDLGALMINAQKAETALQLFIEVRNKLLDSYSEIMRMNV